MNKCANSKRQQLADWLVDAEVELVVAAAADKSITFQQVYRKQKKYFDRCLKLCGLKPADMDLELIARCFLPHDDYNCGLIRLLNFPEPAQKRNYLSELESLREQIIKIADFINDNI